MSSKVPLRADLVRDDISTTAVLGQEPVFGYIEDEFDADIYTFQTDGGPVILNAETTNAGNLDIRLGLYNSRGDILVHSDPAGLDSSLSTNVSPGTYYVLVDMVVVDALGRPVQSATVLGEFSGAVSGTATSSSKRTGGISIRSSKYRDSGNVIFTVKDVFMEGYIFAAD